MRSGPCVLQTGRVSTAAGASPSGGGGIVISAHVSDVC